MKNALIAIGVVMVLFVLVGVGTVVSVYNTCVVQEAAIKAQYTQNQNNYDNFFKSVVESAQVADKYKSALREVFDGAMTSRYGKDGVKSMWTWLQEHNPNLDASVYTKIQQIVQSGRINFEENQKLLIDKKQIYEVQLAGFPNGFIAKAIGFPKIDLEKYGIVTSEVTSQAFETKKADPIKF